ncbi:hypothetical protein AAEO57_02500 [Flavobacterium sp. DGU38]|uniref:Uncharacterized protein n=1 Tax=Flavobacterium calami TaxID=3139144 RepID=A0ABU9IJM3_9FLAO
MIKKIRFYELAMSGEYHVEINLGLLLIMSKIYTDYDYKFHGEKNHVARLLKRNVSKKIKYKAFPFFPKAILKTILLRDFFGCIYSTIGFFTSKKNDILFFTNVLPFTHWSIFILNWFFRRDCFICLHGQLEAYMPGNNLRFTKYYFSLQLPIYKNDKRSKYVVFGDMIYKQIKNIFNNDAKCIVIDHPYIYDYKLDSKIKLDLPIKIGQIGVGDYGKGTQFIFKLADLLKPYILESKVKIYLVGKLNEGLRYLDNGLVEWNTEPLSREDFNSKIEELHFSLFFRDKTTGTVVASGSFMDTVKYLKPYLAIDNPYIEFYNSKFPNSGELFENVEMMALYISNFIELSNKNEYFDKISSLRALQDSLSMVSITQKFKEQI